MKKTLASESVRFRLDQLIRENQNDDYASVSSLIGRNRAYIQQFIKRGVPKRLPEPERRILAEYFGVPETDLGALPPAHQDYLNPQQSYKTGGLTFVPAFDVNASAGDGSLIECDAVEDFWPFRSDWLAALTTTDPKNLAIIAVKGDSMFPTLANDDRILVDTGCRTPVRDGIYVLRNEGVLHVKRISAHPVKNTLTIRSDNTLYESWPDCAPEDVDIIGKVVWISRPL